MALKKLLLTVPSGNENSLALRVVPGVSLPENEGKVNTSHKSVDLPECGIDEDTIDNPCKDHQANKRVHLSKTFFKDYF